MPAIFQPNRRNLLPGSLLTPAAIHGLERRGWG